MAEWIALEELAVYHNYRQHDPEGIAARAEDMRANGYRESYPIELCPNPDGGYYIISGHGRHESATLAGLGRVYANVFPEIVAGSMAFHAMQLRENMARKQSTPLEDGRQLQSMIDDGLTIEEAIVVSDHGAQWVRDRLTLAGCDPVLQAFSARYGIRYATAAADLPPQLITSLIATITADGGKRINLDYWSEIVGMARHGWQETLDRESSMFDPNAFLVSQEWDTKLGAYVDELAQREADDLERGLAFLTVKDAAAYLGLTRSAILKAIQRGTFPPADIRLGQTPGWHLATIQGYAVKV